MESVNVREEFTNFRAGKSLDSPNWTKQLCRESASSWHGSGSYRATSLKRKCTPLGPYRRHMPSVLGGS